VIDTHKFVYEEPKPVYREPVPIKYVYEKPRLVPKEVVDTNLYVSNPEKHQFRNTM